MKPSTFLALALSMGAVDATAQTGSQTGTLSRTDLQSVSPALGRYATDKLADDLWKRPGCRRATAASSPSPRSSPAIRAFSCLNR